MSHACRISKKHYEEVAAAFPELAKSNFRAALEQWIEMLRAGKELGSRLETSLQSTITSKFEPISPATYTGKETASVSAASNHRPADAIPPEAASPKSKTYDWTQVPECPQRYEDKNLCIKATSRHRRNIIEEITPEICKRCQCTLKINEKVADIENKAVQERLRTSNWLRQHEVERTRQQEKSEPTPEEQSSQPEIGYTPSKPTGFVPKRLSELRGPDE